FFPRLDPNFKGLLVVACSSPISAVALIAEGALLGPIPRVALRALDAQTTLYLPHVPDGSTANGQYRMTSTFLLSNPQPSTANVSIKLTNDQGGPFYVTINGARRDVHTVQLPANGSALLETDGAPLLTSGSAVVTSNVAVNASLIYSYYDVGSRATLSLA